MKFLKLISSAFLLLVISFTFTQCASSQKLQKKMPFDLGETYFQNWNSGIKHGDSGTNLYISINANNEIALDSVYFKNQVKKLELLKNNIYVAHFITKQKPHINLSSNREEEYGNTIQKQTKPIPFVLNNDECVITFKHGEKTMYYKILNISKKPSINYPSTTHNKQ
ncbi:hypothetical protein [Algibacter sp. L4_22]|uniref:hypothetical protein n=1 Tax=Algibacter sp. L4_22 TaxID=2942477 RepID=UPI00201B8EE0|nr:hypothetical protein [Algibacter sp. L4_22]MCL5127286.1 hypothetical protein [Algibacter sp. L4_22]